MYMQRDDLSEGKQHYI